MPNIREFLIKIGNFIMSPFSIKLISNEDYNTSIELKNLLDNSDTKGKMKPEDREIVHSLMEFQDSIVREVMVPRIDMKCINSKDSISSVRKSVKEHTHSRLPVYKDKIDNIIGIIHVKDLLFYNYQQEPELKIIELMREPYFVPETKKVNDLLREFQNKNLHMAIVVDEYGGVAGLITIEDLLEEIVGEIKDEYDHDEEIQIEKESDNTYILDARFNIDEFEDHFKVTAPEGDFDTVGGLISHMSGTVSKVGDEFSLGNLKIEILKADAKKIGKIKVIINEQREDTGDKKLDMV